MPSAHLIEDDPVIRELVRRVLEDASWTVSESPDGRRAVEDVTAAAPDVVVLDINMPGPDGWTVLEQLRSVSDVRVLMLSQRTAMPDRLRSLRAGADDYVPKPFDPEQLVARMQALLDRPPGDRSLLF